MGKEGGSRQREGAEQAKMIDFFGDVGRRIEEDEEERTGSPSEGASSVEAAAVAQSLRPSWAKDINKALLIGGGGGDADDDED